MRNEHWERLIAAVEGKATEVPVGFIIDSPWLPNWCGMTIREYLANETRWLDANLRALEVFPECIFLPGFWAEFGMCTEPSAFGARCVFPPDEFPFPEKSLHDIESVDRLPDPDPATDGLLPFVLERLRWAQPRIEETGSSIRFSVSRGPLNVATFLMGTTEFLMALKTEPDAVHKLLQKITRFLLRWHEAQRAAFPTIDGIMVLDDIVGFLGENDFVEFGLPYLREIYQPPARVKFFHNDAPCAKSVRYYADTGINLYNPGTQSTLTEIRKLSAGKLAILGNVPPRDVLQAGTPEEVRAGVRKVFEEAGNDRSRLILSCAGGMPPGAPTENIRAMIDEAARAAEAS
jgi:uroporphyrinogen-III decarboxylase